MDDPVRLREDVVGQVLGQDLCLGGMGLGRRAQLAGKGIAPIGERDRRGLGDLRGELEALVEVGGEEAARHRVRQLLGLLLEQPDEDQRLLQRVAAQLFRSRQSAVTVRHVALGVALDDGAAELGLALEVVEEGALGDPGPFDHLVDRSRAEAVVEDQGLGGVEQIFAGRGAGPGHELIRF